MERFLGSTSARSSTIKKKEPVVSETTEGSKGPKIRVYLKTGQKPEASA